MTDACPAIGIRLAFTTTEAGGRRTPLLGGNSTDVRMQYRPNWGLPGWPDGDQTGAPVLGFSTSNIRPGDTTDAIIIPLFADNVPQWWDVAPDDVLRMYEGSRVCGVATVLWVDRTTLKLSEAEAERLLKRLSA
ncbi:hypothetical protein [Agromyces mariniharenae]|uniref:Uncharacterized protein n=1 Tax=Agromyces mariniharenae TaxID=2604423 RepID=A0A5S4UWV0_9MICO|nr:hypothetical protein [Agromyces mariniharenae]TYL51046.1 hypothetical protein FYC51_18110 [Agromyces mariniharenae]